MGTEDESPTSSEWLQSSEWPEIVRKIRARTPARLLAGRAGAAYRTHTQLELRAAHAAARDAVRTELDLEQTFSPSFAQQWKLFEVATQAATKDEFLLRPDLGRHFSPGSSVQIQQRCPSGKDLQIAIADGLSVTAVAVQVPRLLPLLCREAAVRGWSIGQSFVIRHGRVGILNEIGELLSPQVVVLLIGERPGLATSESLSAYLAYRPQQTHVDADRNLISNIHDRGVKPENAATRILNLADQMMKLRISGSRIKERFVRALEP